MNRNTNQVFGVSNEVVETYIERPKVDRMFTEGLEKNKHIIVYGASKQGKTSLTNKHLTEEDFIKVNCSPRSRILDLYNSIVRQLDIEILDSRESEVTVGEDTSSGLQVKVSIPSMLSVNANTSNSVEAGVTNTSRQKIIEYNLALAQDLSELLRTVDFKKRIILENFHYLDEDVQRQLSIDLRIFEDYNILFIILGIWREKNKLSQFNGDLVDRVIEIPVEPWGRDDLLRIVRAGEPLLNVDFEEVDGYLIDACFDSVGVFQEICKESCKAAGVRITQDSEVKIEMSHVEIAIKEKLEDYSSRHMRCLHAFIEQKAKSSDEVPLYIPYYFIKVLLSQPFESITAGLKRRMIQEKIKEIHHRPDNVRASDMGYFLTTLVSTQIKKNISPPIFDFDSGAHTVKIIDSTFYFYLKNSDLDEVLEFLPAPPGI